MSMRRRVRIMVTAGAALICGGVAASIVSNDEAKLRAQVGPLVPVVVAAAGIPEGKLVTPASASSLLVQRRVPGRFVPPNALHDPTDASGFRTAAAVSAGDYLTRGLLITNDHEIGRSAGVGTGSERLIQMAVSGGTTVLAQLEPGARVDVLVTSDRGGEPRTYLALQRVELVATSDGSAGSTPTSGDQTADAIATLRVSLKQAVLLTAAQNFAREIRLVPRPSHDRRLLAPVLVTAKDLRP
jgi:pilus assembly protein CpaB